MRSIANREYVIELGNRLDEQITKLANGSPSAGAWTKAVYASLKSLAEEKKSSGFKWKIYPEERCYSGEYLCDFMIFEEGYGCRLACESQWANVRTQHQAGLEWAFDKLLGVKADIKLFVFDGDKSHWPIIQDNYLKNFAQLSSEEIFLLMRWEGYRLHKYVWQPVGSGLQHDICFTEF